MSIEATEKELWKRYREQGDSAARDFLFMKYTGWARAVAASVYRRLRVSQMEWLDYVQNSQIGLMEAMSRFDATRNIDFMAYAKPRVRGAVFNGLRLVLREEKHSRDLVGHGFDRMQSLAESPTDEPLGDFVGSVVGLALGYLLETEQFSQTTGYAQEMLERQELGELLKEAMLELEERERDILTSHYFLQIPFQVIALDLGVSKGRVSQIHKAALMKVRESLLRRQYDFQSL